MSEENETLQPMTLWEKIKAGVSGFVRNAVGCIPRIILTAGLIFGGASLLGMYGGEFGKGIADLAGVGDGQWSTVGKKMLFSLALGSVISGGIGAMQNVSQANEQRNALIALQQRGVPVRAMAPHLSQHLGGGEMGAGNLRPSHLPVEIAHHLSAHMR